jgi:hypothetical protein
MSEPANWQNLYAAIGLLVVLCLALGIAARVNAVTADETTESEPTGRNEWTTFPTNDVASVLPLVSFVIYVAGVGLMVLMK